jgi:hypothetical protein
MCCERRRGAEMEARRLLLTTLAALKRAFLKEVRSLKELPV